LIEPWEAGDGDRRSRWDPALVPSTWGRQVRDRERRVVIGRGDPVVQRGDEELAEAERRRGGVGPGATLLKLMTFGPVMPVRPIVPEVL
jgi:hypothetical protein